MKKTDYKSLDISGQKFGRLLVLERIPIKKTNTWKCKCDCGNEKIVRGYSLIKGSTKSCGCFSKEKTIQRCKKQPYFHLYTYLKRNAKWRKKIFHLNFEEFVEFTKIEKCHYCGRNILWAKHSNHESSPYNLDRKNNNLGYTKTNCVVSCKECNYVKSNKYSYEEMIKIGLVLNEIHRIRTDKFVLAK
jgi:hypothetical protein